MYNYLDFEKPVQDLEGKILELKKLSESGEAVDVAEEIARLEKRVAGRLARHLQGADAVAEGPGRAPSRTGRTASTTSRRLFSDFTPLAGDRNFGEDAAIVGGFARFRGEPVAVLGQEKGSDTKSRLKHNFGSVRPEGYRKAVRIMELADRYKVPMISLVDTAGAYPGIGAEERGQAEAIARSTSACLGLKIPSMSIVIGEGGSGGAIAIATANRVYMLEHADLFGDLAGGRGLDPVARHDALQGSRDQHEDHRAGPARPQDHRRHHPRAARRRPSRAGGGGQRDGRPDRQDARRIRAVERSISASTGARSIWRWAVLGLRCRSACK